jgi:hypothetical protein
MSEAASARGADVVIAGRLEIEQALLEASFAGRSWLGEPDGVAVHQAVARGE